MKITFNNSDYNHTIRKLYKIKNYQHLAKDCFIRQNDISFKHNLKPVYIITEDGKYSKCETIMDAAKQLGLSRQAIASGIKYKSITGNKYIIARPEEAEEEGPEGKSEVSQDKINNLISRFKDRNRQYGSIEEKPIYAISKNGEIKKYGSKKEAASELFISVDGIKSCLRGRAYTAGGYIFLNPEDIEINDNGNIIPDENKIREALKVYNEKYTQYEYMTGPVYSIDLNENYKKFQDKKEAEKEYGLFASGILACLRHKTYTCGGYIFIKADEIETTDEFGNKVIDPNKLKEVISAVKNKGRRSEIYVIDKSGEYKKFPSIADASRELKISANTIQMHLSNKIPNPNRYAFVRAEDIEKEDSSGNICVDLSKLDEIKKQINTPVRNNRIRLYTIDSEGNYKYYDSIKDAASSINSSSSCINKCLNGISSTANGYVIVPAEKVETTDENGKISVDETKLKELNKTARIFRLRKSTAIYKITKEGKFKRYDSIKQAEKDNDLAQSTILKCLNKHTTIDSFSFVYASEIDVYDENGNYKTQKEPLKAYYKKIFGERPIKK